MRTKNKGVWIALFTIPCMVLFALVYAAPIVTVAYTSFCDYSVFSGPVFTGLKNFIMPKESIRFGAAQKEQHSNNWKLLQM